MPYATPRTIAPRRGIIPDSMTKVESIERGVEKLTPEELAAFRHWFVEHDWQHHDDGAITARLNEAYDTESSTLDPVLQSIQARSIKKGEWT